MVRPAIFFISLTTALSLISACASKPIIDTQNVDMVQYEKDLAHCEEVAEQVASGEITLSSTAFGAGVGAAYGAIDGDVGRSAGRGAVTGASAGLLKQDNEKSRVTKNCLRYRGYAVLN